MRRQFVLGLLCLMAACAEKTSYPPPNSVGTNYPPADFPETLQMQLVMRNWQVEGYETYPQLDSRYTVSVDRTYFISEEDVGIRLLLRTARGAKTYDLILRGVPRNGVVSGVAQKIDVPFAKRDLPAPRSRIEVDLVVRQRRIVSNIIRQGGRDTVGLYIDQAFRAANGQKLIRIRSRYFPEAVWHAALPTRDGRFTITALLQS